MKGNKDTLRRAMGKEENEYINSKRKCFPRCESEREGATLRTSKEKPRERMLKKRRREALLVGKYFLPHVFSWGNHRAVLWCWGCNCFSSLPSGGLPNSFLLFIPPTQRMLLPSVRFGLNSLAIMKERKERRGVWCVSLQV